jgi:hypothetical protein
MSRLVFWSGQAQAKCRDSTGPRQVDGNSVAHADIAGANLAPSPLSSYTDGGTPTAGSDLSLALPPWLFDARNGDRSLSCVRGGI